MCAGKMKTPPCREAGFRSDGNAGQVRLNQRSVWEEHYLTLHSLLRELCILVKRFVILFSDRKIVVFSAPLPKLWFKTLERVEIDPATLAAHLARPGDFDPFFGHIVRSGVKQISISGRQ